MAIGEERYDELERAWSMEQLDEQAMDELLRDVPEDWVGYQDDQRLRRDFQDVYDLARVRAALGHVPRRFEEEVHAVGREGGRLSRLQPGAKRYLGYVHLLAVLRRLLTELREARSRDVRAHASWVGTPLHLINLRREQDLEEGDLDE
jgi:hypothetical protein